MKQFVTCLIIGCFFTFQVMPAMGQHMDKAQPATASALEADQDQDASEEIRFHGNYPNPVKSETRFKFEVDRQVQVFITLYDLLGNELKQITKKVYNPGVYKVKFDASDLEQGVYFYSFKAGDVKITKRLSKVND